jgi:hypothetical protein
VKFHWVSGIFETRTCEFKIRDYAKSDFPIWSRGIIRSILWVSESPDKGLEELSEFFRTREEKVWGEGVRRLAIARVIMPRRASLWP